MREHCSGQRRINNRERLKCQSFWNHKWIATIALIVLLAKAVVACYKLFAKIVIINAACNRPSEEQFMCCFSSSCVGFSQTNALHHNSSIIGLSELNPHFSTLFRIATSNLTLLRKRKKRKTATGTTHSTTEKKWKTPANKKATKA